MPVNLDKPQRWKADTQRSVDDYNRWFLEYAPLTYRETRARATVYVEDMLLRTDNLRRLTAPLLPRRCAGRTGRTTPGTLPTPTTPSPACVRRTAP